MMGQAMGMLDFFVLEAGEYLERLDALAQTPAGPFPAEEFLRIARAFRGSALMAGQQSLARAAQGLESAARAARDGRLAWEEHARSEVVRAVDDCKTLLTRVRTPAAEDAAQAEAVGAALERLAGRAASPRVESAGLDAGSRAFIAREAASVASTLDWIARALTADPAGREPLDSVAPSMSALRGVAVLSDLPPLPDILVAVDSAVKETRATPGAVDPAVPAVFDSAARALARAAREVVDIGRPMPDSQEATAFAARLFTAFAGAGASLPIERLFYDDAGPHIIRRGEAVGGLPPVELVSHGEFLATTASDLRRAASPVLRDLRLFGLAASLRPLAAGGGSPVAGGLAELADVGRAVIERGAAAANLDAFLMVITEAAEALRSAESGNEAAVAARLDAASAQLHALEERGARVVPPRRTRVVPEMAEPEVSEEPAVPEVPEVREVSEVPEEPEVSAEPALEATGVGSGLAEGYTALERLVAERGLPPGSLDELVGAPLAPAPAAATASLQPAAPAPSWAAEDEGVVPIEALAPAEPPEQPPRPEEPTRPAPEIVPIEDLLYHGADALKRAVTLRQEIEELLAIHDGDSPRLSELLREVFDLVELGLGARR
jgi:HPt (histidine-containing phosphotransfer) domain-containing protein